MHAPIAWTSSKDDVDLYPFDVAHPVVVARWHIYCCDVYEIHWCGDCIESLLMVQL